MNDLEITAQVLVLAALSYVWVRAMLDQRSRAREEARGPRVARALERALAPRRHVHGPGAPLR